MGYVAEYETNDGRCPLLRRRRPMRSRWVPAYNFVYDGLGPVAPLGYMVVISKGIECRDQGEFQIGRHNTATNSGDNYLCKFQQCGCGERLLRKRVFKNMGAPRREKMLGTEQWCS